ncbi:MAG: hypothetical protein ABJB74_04140 [Gemmatimonas sp.]
MILDSVPPNASLGSILHARAVAATPMRLVLNIVVGAGVAAAAAWAHKFWWITATCAGLCVAFYGVWAFAERRLETGPDVMSQTEETGLSILRVGAALAGLAAALIFTFSLVSVLLGTWIS